ncbi:DoxX family protein [Mycolicibacterium tokaiense]|uniref:DoxX family protein n=1 Tax=Mycolicibacterium tokaiense TaxID=39695 RepID=A0A378TMZ1_9MYCO|nr:DoxX family protein [Mycolicibacterium tokaiense]STZ62089.1 DoxX family protein [Mycolicibacterium tokaiense]
MLLRRVARPLLSAAFIGQGIEALRSPKPAADAARPTLEGLQKLPEPVGPNVPKDAETFAKITAAVQIGGGVLLATGKVPRLASAALAATVIPANLGSHMFWSEADPELKAQKRKDFLVDLSLLGGLIIASADTAGKPSIGWRSRRAAHKVSNKVTAALPSGSTPALIDGEVVDKVGKNLQGGLHAGAERSRELAERSAPLLGAARERGAELAEIALDRGSEWAHVARERGAELAEIARERGLELADVARDRGGDFADVARDRGIELADVARDRGLTLAEVARDRGGDLAHSALSHSEDLSRKARKKARKQAKALRR